MSESIQSFEIGSTPALYVSGLGDFSLARTLDCGQCFRFNESKTHTSTIEGIAHGRFLRLSQPREGSLVLFNVDEEEYTRVWRKFFSFDRDWTAIRADIEARSPELKEAAAGAEGIRILTQDRFEALVSFIISQCNNIPRIKGLVEALSEKYGERIEGAGGKCAYAFPTPEAILARPLSELTALKVGYRDEYIYSACRAVCDGILDEISAAPTTAEAEKIILSMHGIGKKVAACVLLFGFGRYDAFPVDVWMKRALERLFPGVRDYSAFGPYAGVAQQYMFYCERYTRK